jgi:hypothetical protein
VSLRRREAAADGMSAAQRLAKAPRSSLAACPRALQRAARGRHGRREIAKRPGSVALHAPRFYMSRR